ncbi:hypothetical protein ARSEF1564_008404, partial [Beauveria bassiana]
MASTRRASMVTASRVRLSTEEDVNPATTIKGKGYPQ